MFSRSRKSAASSSKGKAARVEAPFEKRRREIAEMESNLQAQLDRAKHFIDTAPKIAQERQKKQREAFLSNAVSPASLDGIRLPDPRISLNASAATTQRSRRRDQRRGKWVFFMLVLALILAAWWAWQTLFQSAF